MGGKYLVVLHEKNIGVLIAVVVIALPNHLAVFAIMCTRCVSLSRSLRPQSLSLYEYEA